MNKADFGKAVCLGGITVAVVGLVAGFLGRFWIEVDVLSHFRLHFALAIMAFAIAWFAAKPLRVPVALVLMAAGMIAIGSWSKLSADQLKIETNVPAGTRTLNIMHFNIWGRNRQLDDVGAEVARLDPDILFLTEVGKNRQRLTAILDQRFPYRLPDKGSSASELVLYSKFPFAASDRQHRLDGLNFIRGTLGSDWHHINIIGTHISRPPAIRSQARQIGALAILVNQLKGASIVAGDFNATPYSVMLEDFRSRTGLKRVTNLPTWPTLGPNLPQFAIDHIFTSDELRLAVPAIVGRFAGSDHLPVAASILVPQSN